ncbi:MAG: tyrosine-protein phosphatase [Candidatus Sericytochromatia bacterium]|nr:tyrosine-protein phosphatase [Candidatus Tanganyikabacteria bacterium]
MPDPLKHAIAGALHGILEVRGFGRIAHRVYDVATRLRLDTPHVANTGSLGDSLLRGAQPTPSGFATLRRQGVDTVVNLRPESDWEATVVERCGMRYHKVPLSVMGPPTRDQALAFLAITTDPASGTVFFHCYHGSDRTGAMGAVYRIAADGWDFDRAVAEMRHYGFHDGYQDTKLEFLRDFQAYWQGLPDARRLALLHRSSGREQEIPALDAAPPLQH